MTGIIRREFRVFSAANLVDDINAEGNQENNVYMGIAKSSAWADENTPDTPDTKESTLETYWDDIIGMTKIPAAQVALVVPRNDWTSGTTYPIFDKTTTDDVAYNTKFYVVNSENRVYECITSSGAANTVEPLAVNEVLASGVRTVTSDSYVWKYLYTITTGDADRFKTPNWIPVNFEDSTSSGTAIVANNEQLNSHLILGAKRVMFYGLISADGVVISDSTTYRQIGLHRNPIIDDGSATLATANEFGLISGVGFVDAGSESGSGNEMIRNSGEFMYMENKKSVQRVNSQTEEIRLIVEY